MKVHVGVSCFYVGTISGTLRKGKRRATIVRNVSSVHIRIVDFPTQSDIGKYIRTIDKHDFPKYMLLGPQ